MKIVQLIYHLGSGGAERFVVNLSNELARRGEDVTILMLRDRLNPSFNFNCKLLLPQIQIISLNLKEGFRISYLWKVSRALDSIAPDVVHTHLDVLPYILFYAISHRIRYIHTIHSVANFETNKIIIKKINKFLFCNNLVQPVTISNLCNDSFIEYYKLKNSVCIENGCERICPSAQFQKVKDELRELPRPVFIHVARYAKEKNQQLLVQTFNALQGQDFPGTLLVVGDGFSNDSGIVTQAGPGIYFLGRKDNVGDYLMNSDYFCLSSIVEGAPISVIEAMSCGLPVITTPAGGIPDMISNGVTGVISKDFSRDSYMQAFKECISIPFDAKAIMMLFNNRYSISVCAEKYILLYKNEP